MRGAIQATETFGSVKVEQKPADVTQDKCHQEVDHYIRNYIKMVEVRSHIIN